MSGKFRYVFLLVLGLAVVGFTAKDWHKTYTVYLMVDTIHDTASGTGLSLSQDTFSVVNLVYDGFEIAGHQFNAILNLSSDTLYGIGDSSIGYMYLYTRAFVGGNYQYWKLASDSSELPCTLRSLVSYAATNDTLYKEGMFLGWKIVDTTTSVMRQPSYSLSVDLKLIGK